MFNARACIFYLLLFFKYFEPALFERKYIKIRVYMITDLPKTAK